MKYLIFSILITLVLVAFSQLNADPEPVAEGIWIHISKSESGQMYNTLIVEEDSSLTVIDLPVNLKSLQNLQAWLENNFDKEIGQLIISSKANIDTNLIPYANPKVIHNFESVVKLMGAGELVENKADISTEIGNFTVFDATPRLSMLYPGKGKTNKNLILFNLDDKLVYLGSFFGNNINNLDKQDNISENIQFLLKNTDSCEKFIPRIGDIISKNELDEILNSLK